jgi:DNA-binding phage protein
VVLSSPLATIFAKRGKKVIELDKLREILSDRNLSAVAKGAGLAPRTLYAFVRNGGDPRYSTIVRLLRYLERQEVLRRE